MYTKRNMVYAEPYKMLEGDGIRAYQAKGNPDDFREIDCPIDDMTIQYGIAVWGNGKNRTLIPETRTYAAIKAYMVKKRYSNDDQLAVMLNGDSEDMRRMQQWRDWASAVAKAICKRIGVKC